jgi:aspartate aminotransferase
MLSKRIQSVSPSATVAITTRAKQMIAEGIDVVSFAAGEPDFDTPDCIKEAAITALNDGDTKYNPRKGKALLEALVVKLQRDNGLTVTPEQIVMTFGGKHALYDAFQIILDEGDRVLIPAPYWVSYPSMVKLAGGEPVALETSPETNFKVTPQQILDNAKGAKVLVLNSPSNPTGVTYTRDELKAIADAVLQTDLLVFSDEIYERLVYGDTESTCFAALDPRLEERTLTFNGLAKTYSMTGWRLGWVTGPKEMIGSIRKLMSHETTNPVSFAQAGALAAYTDPRAEEAVVAMRAEFEKRGKHMASRLNAIDGVTCCEPTGAFYCFPDVSAHFGKEIAGVKIDGSLEFAQVALADGNIAVVPGVAFGEDRCVRLSFATSMEQIDKGIDRLEALLK